MRAYGALLVAALFLLGCGGPEPELACEGELLECGEPSYFPLCAEPEPNDAVEDLDGIYCAFNENGFVYIGPELERAPACEGGDVPACPDGEQPVCYFLPNCLEANLP
jgi:hypothetical protein